MKEEHPGDIINRLVEGMSVEFEIETVGDKERIVAVHRPLDVIAARLNADPTQVSLVALNMRPGVRYFSTVLEHTYYSPLGPKSHLFKFRLAMWEEMLWAILSIPAADKHLFDDVASRTGMRIGNGVPSLLEAGGMKHFPVEKYAYALENVLRNDQPHYKATAETVAAMAQGTMTMNEGQQRIKAAEDEMGNWEEEAIRKFFRDKNINGGTP